MIQELTDAVYHNAYHEQSPSKGDYIMFVNGRNVLIKNDESLNSDDLEYPHWEEIGVEMDYRYLFMIEVKGKPQKFFLGEENLLPEHIKECYHYERQNAFRVKKPDYMAFAGITACQLANWYASTKFCSACGARLVHDGKERMLRCPDCNAMHYPKISPAVIVAVTDGDRIVMTKYAGRDYKKYALIAGFTEIGETAEETVRREVMEEVGLKVKNIRYYKSQPWPFSDTLLLGFYYELDGSDRIKLDESELSVGEWLYRDEMPTEYDGISLTNEMMMRFKSGDYPSSFSGFDKFGSIMHTPQSADC